MKKVTKRKLSYYTGLMASLLLIISGTSGVTLWTNIQTFLLNYINSELIKSIFFFILIIATFGGISVFFGSILILKKNPFIGRIFISIGSGASILGIVLNIIARPIEASTYFTTSSIGIFLSIIAILISRE